MQAHRQSKASLELARSNRRKVTHDHTIIRTQSRSLSCTQLHIPPTKDQNKAQPAPTTTPKHQGQPQRCCSTVWLPRRLGREQCTQVQQQVTRAMQMSEPMTFKNSMAVILGKEWERGRKAPHSHSNRSSERKGDAGMWLLSFQSICHIIKSLAWELIKAWFSFPATCCYKAHTDPCVKVHAVYTPASTITQLSQTTLTFFQTHRKNEAHGEVSKQSGICRKTAACLLQVCSVIGKN